MSCSGFSSPPRSRKAGAYCGGFVRKATDLLFPEIINYDCIKSVAWPAR